MRMPWQLAVVLSCGLMTAAAPLRAGEPEQPAVYIVQLAEAPVASYRGGVKGIAATRPGPGGPRKLDAAASGSRLYAGHLLGEQDRVLAAAWKALGREVAPLAQYTLAFHGLALELTPEEARRIARLPGVRRVEPERPLLPQSDAGPQWTGATGIWDGTATGGLPGTKGEGIVVGVIDTGIHAGHPSFADVGGDGYNHINPRGAGNYVGRCDPATPDYDPALPCNDKLIGIWSYGDAPEDEYGHGTHVASIAAGNHVTATLANSLATLSRPISGMAPHANLIAYDVCWDGYCSEYSVISALDQAVADGVDVASLGFGGYGGPWNSAVGAALLGARDAGVLVVVPAGNSDYFSSLTGVAETPWVLTTGATTHDRAFLTSLSGSSGGGSVVLHGVGLSPSYGPAPIVRAASYDSSNYACEDPFPAGTFTGQIVVCDYYGWISVSATAENVRVGGGGGAVLRDIWGDGYPGSLAGFTLPGLFLSESSSSVLGSWLAAGSGHTATISATTTSLDPARGDVLYPYSAQGPSDYPDVLKPDLAAPGAEILAASRGPEGFAVLSGSSMAAAHAAGAAALIRALHPDWTAAEVQSALMTTADSTVVRVDGTATTPFGIGAGRLDAGAASRAGLLLDETAAAFELADPAQGGRPETLNLPSLADGACVRTCVWTRTVRNALSFAATWNATVSAPAGFTVTVTPSSFTLGPGGTQTVQVAFNAPSNVFGWYHAAVRFGEAGGLAPAARLPISAQLIPEYQLTVNRLGTGSGRVTSNPAGIDCGADCSQLYPEDTSVVLTAVPDPGSVFAGWAGFCYGVQSTCWVDMYVNRTATAWFVVPPPDKPLSNGAPLKDSMNAPVEGGIWAYYFFDVPAGTGELVVDLLDVTDEAALYLRQGSKPTWNQYNCADWGYEANRRCVITAPAAGRWWVGVNNDYATGLVQYTVRASWGNADGSDRGLANGMPAADFLTSNQSGDSWKYYFVDLELGGDDLVVELAGLSADADLYVRHGAKPNRSTYDCQSSQGSTVPDRCSIDAPAPGRWWIGVNSFSTGTTTYSVEASWTPAPAFFYTVAPCRVFDTRASSPLASGVSRVFAVAGTCGIPATARAIVANVTSVVPAGNGYMTLYPGNLPAPTTSTINFRAGQVRANNAILGLATDGSGSIRAVPAVAGGGQVHLILDVSGYFE